MSDRDDESVPDAAKTDASEPAEAAAAPAAAAASPHVEAALGAKGRRALLAKLAPLEVPGGQVLDAMKLEPEGDLAKVLDLTADDFLDPLWERMQGRSA